MHRVTIPPLVGACSGHLFDGVARSVLRELQLEIGKPLNLLTLDVTLPLLARIDLVDGTPPAWPKCGIGSLGVQAVQALEAVAGYSEAQPLSVGVPCRPEPPGVLYPRGAGAEPGHCQERCLAMLRCLRA